MNFNISHHSPGCIVYFSPPKSVLENKATDRFLDNKIAEEIPEGGLFGESGNNPVRFA